MNKGLIPRGTQKEEPRREVVEETFKDKKVLVFKYKSKKDYHRLIGHRQQYTKVRVDSITLA